MSFSDIEQKIFGSSSETMRWVCQTCDLRSWCPLDHLEDFFWMVFFFILAPWEKTYGPFVKYFQAWFSKMQFTCPKKPFEYNFFLFSRKNERFLNVLWHWAKKYRTLARKFFFRSVKTAIYMSLGVLSRKFVFFLKFSSDFFSMDIERKITGLLAKSFGTVIKALSVSKGTSWGKIFSSFLDPDEKESAYGIFFSGWIVRNAF